MLLAATLGILAAGAMSPELFAGVPRIVPDFGVYYGCAKVNASGQNPYEGDAQAEAQRAINPEFPPLRANSGPWTLAVLRPFTLFDYGAARAAWLMLELALLFFAGGALWRIYDGDPNNVSASWIFAISGYASLQSLILGQTSPFVFAGLVGFLVLQRQGRNFLAGLCLAGLLVKPQNQLIFCGVLALWMLERRQWKVFAGAACGGLMLTAVALAGNPHTFAQYLEALSQRPPTEWLPPLPATLLRLSFGYDRYWLTMLPLIPGTLWGIAYYAKHRENWDWAERLPLVLLVSYLASPYGWAYDQLVFLVPLLQLAARFSRRPGSGVLLLLAVHFTLTIYYFAMLNRDVPEFHWVWLPPCALGGYLVLTWKPQPALAPA